MKEAEARRKAFEKRSAEVRARSAEFYKYPTVLNERQRHPTMPPWQVEIGPTTRTEYRGYTAGGEKIPDIEHAIPGRSFHLRPGEGMGVALGEHRFKPHTGWRGGGRYTGVLR
jgi:hypothetical protein